MGVRVTFIGVRAPFILILEMATGRIRGALVSVTYVVAVLSGMVQGLTVGPLDLPGSPDYTRKGNIF